MRMLNSLLAADQRRGDLAAARRSAQMRLMLPAESSLREAMTAALRRPETRFN